MPEMKSLNGFEVVDAKARADIEALKLGFVPGEGSSTPDLSEYVTESELEAKGYATETYVDRAIDKFSSSGGSSLTQTMYQHHIAIASINGESNNRNIVITNMSSQPFTAQSFVDFLTAGGHTSAENYYPACGGMMDRHQLSTIETTEAALCEVIGVASLANGINVVYTNPANDTSTNTPKGGLATDLVYDPTKGARYDKYYQTFTDKITSFNAAVVGDAATRGYVDNTAASIRAEIAALRAIVQGG